MEATNDINPPHAEEMCAHYYYYYSMHVVLANLQNGELRTCDATQFIERIGVRCSLRSVCPSVFSYGECALEPQESPPLPAEDAGRLTFARSLTSDWVSRAVEDARARRSSPKYEQQPLPMQSSRR